MSLCLGFLGQGTKGLFERIPYRNEPSVLTLRSCRMNHTPMLLSGSVSLKALTQRLPIRFLVNMPLGAERGSCGGPERPIDV